MTQGWGAAQLVGVLIPREAGRVLVPAHIRQPHRRLVRGLYTQRLWGMFLLSHGFPKGWVSIGGYEAPGVNGGMLRSRVRAGASQLLVSASYQGEASALRSGWEPGSFRARAQVGSSVRPWCLGLPAGLLTGMTGL